MLKPKIPDEGVCEAVPRLLQLVDRLENSHGRGTGGRKGEMGLHRVGWDAQGCTCSVHAYLPVKVSHAGMCVSVYVCMHVCLCTYVYACSVLFYICYVTFRHATLCYAMLCVCVCVYTHIRACYIYIYIHTYACMYVCMYVCMHVCTYEVCM